MPDIFSFSDRLPVTVALKIASVSPRVTLYEWPLTILLIYGPGEYICISVFWDPFGEVRVSGRF